MRLKLTREFFIPKTFVAKIEKAGCEVYIIENGPRFSAKGFSGKKAKSDFYFTFKTLEQMQAHVRNYFETAEKVIAAKAERKATRVSVNAADFYKVGDIVSASWGYDQTNVDFFKVTAVLGKSVRIVEVASTVKETGFMCGVTSPDPTVEVENSWNGLHRVQTNGSIRLDSFAYASKWNGKEKACSWYA